MKRQLKLPSPVSELKCTSVSCFSSSSPLIQLVDTRVHAHIHTCIQTHTESQKEKSVRLWRSVVDVIVQAYKNQQNTYMYMHEAFKRWNCEILDEKNGPIVLCISICISDWPFNINITWWLSRKGVNVIQDHIVSIPYNDPELIAGKKWREKKKETEKKRNTFYSRQAQHIGCTLVSNVRCSTYSSYYMYIL